ncbi:MAG: 4Fe-4S binding protein [Clostridiales bacterium]|nr:4Fe-4S binding protein [Bacillota bacterium]NLL55438.1 4Fe-4S binding protein [Clostridiales bacterium]
MARVTIAQETCKGCGLCVDHCPKGILSLSGTINQKGYHAAECTDPDKCIGCAFCARMCPDCAITVEK